MVFNKESLALINNNFDKFFDTEILIFEDFEAKHLKIESEWEKAGEWKLSKEEFDKLHWWEDDLALDTLWDHVDKYAWRVNTEKGNIKKHLNLDEKTDLPKHINDEIQELNKTLSKIKDEIKDAKKIDELVAKLITQLNLDITDIEKAVNKKQWEKTEKKYEKGTPEHLNKLAENPSQLLEYFKKEIEKPNDNLSSKTKLASTMTMAHIDTFDKVEWGREFLWKFFLQETWRVTFYWNHQLERVVWLWEISPDNIEYLKVNGRIWKRVKWSRQRFESKRWRYLAILEKSSVEIPSSEEIENLKKTIFSSDSIKNHKQKDTMDLMGLTSLDNMTPAQKKEYDEYMKKDTPFPAKEDFLRMMSKRHETISLRESQSDQEQRKQWEKITGTINENNITKVLNEFSTSIENSEAISIQDKEAIKKNISELITYMDKNKDSTTDIVKMIKEWIYSPLHIDMKTLKVLIDSQLDIESVELTQKTKELFESRRWRNFKKYLPFLIVASQEYGVPIHTMLNLLTKEWSHWDPTKRPMRNWVRLSSAVWLSQMLDGTWHSNLPSWADVVRDRLNPFHQIRAMAKYLKKLAIQKKCSWEMATVYYHTWASWPNPNTVANYFDKNPAIERMANKLGLAHNVDWYNKAAMAYYNRPEPKVYASRWRASQNINVENVQTGDICSAARAAVDQRIIGTSCWDWVNKVYIAAWVSTHKWRNKIVANKQKLFKGKKYLAKGKNYVPRSTDREFASNQQVSSLKPGDWIYFRNDNTLDEFGDHSGIFMWWEWNSNNQRAILANASWGSPWKIDSETIKWKVTSISRPA